MVVFFSTAFTRLVLVRKAFLCHCFTIEFFVHIIFTFLLTESPHVTSHYLFTIIRIFGKRKPYRRGAYTAIKGSPARICTETLRVRAEFAAITITGQLKLSRFSLPSIIRKPSIRNHPNRQHQNLASSPCCLGPWMERSESPLRFPLVSCSLPPHTPGGFRAIQLLFP